MQNIEPLVLDLVEWVEKQPRAYTEVMEAWKTSCPRLTVWEDAVDHGYLLREKHATAGQRVIVTQAGRQFLEQKGRKPAHR
ncbi:MAG: hypothetical protein HQ483_12890 [Rhodospirillales bacterium]|nr:hypothetical protein [Rhodospirillales bacterium]